MTEIIHTPADWLPSGVDPRQYTLEQLARIRCSIWTARLDIPYGPRPNDPSNILAMDFLDLYDRPTQDRMVSAYRARGYTHVPQGPFLGDGYHGQYPDIDYSVSEEAFSRWLDVQQYLWDNHLAPIHFIQVDSLNKRPNWESIKGWMRGERAQRLMRLVCYTGWEPSQYDWPNSQWVDYFAEGRAIFPHAAQFIHMPQDQDAPNGGDDGLDNAECWRRVAPYLHGWLIQVGGYLGQGTSDAQTFKPALDAYAVDLQRRFHAGYAGWPTSSAWGAGRPLKLIWFEYAAYNDYWSNWPEDEARKLGDYAIAAGLDGYGDGGTVDVS